MNETQPLHSALGDLIVWAGGARALPRHSMAERLWEPQRKGLPLPGACGKGREHLFQGAAELGVKRFV